MATVILSRNWSKAKPNVIQKLKSKGPPKVRIGRTEVKIKAGKRRRGL